MAWDQCVCFFSGSVHVAVCLWGSLRCVLAVCVFVCVIWQCACEADCRCVCTTVDVRGVRRCVISVCEESVCVCVLGVAVDISSLIACFPLFLSSRRRVLWAVLALAKRMTSCCSWWSGKAGRLRSTVTRCILENGKLIYLSKRAGRNDCFVTKIWVWWFEASLFQPRPAGVDIQLIKWCSWFPAPVMTCNCHYDYFYHATQQKDYNDRVMSVYLLVTLWRMTAPDSWPPGISIHWGKQLLCLFICWRIRLALSPVHEVSINLH